MPCSNVGTASPVDLLNLSLLDVWLQLLPCCSVDCSSQTCLLRSTLLRSGDLRGRSTLTSVVPIVTPLLWSVPLNRLLLLPNHKLQQVEKDASQASALLLPWAPTQRSSASFEHCTLLPLSVPLNQPLLLLFLLPCSLSAFLHFTTSSQQT
jgi:hypothetical protein